MAFNVHGEDDLGVAGCDYVASGETAEEVIDEMSAHLRDEHDVDLPDTELILSEDQINLADDEEQLVVSRLREALNLGDQTDTSDTSDDSAAVVPPGDMPGNV